MDWETETKGETEENWDWLNVSRMGFIGSVVRESWMWSELEGQVRGSKSWLQRVGVEGKALKGARAGVWTVGALWKGGGEGSACALCVNGCMGEVLCIVCEQGWCVRECVKFNV